MWICRCTGCGMQVAPTAEAVVAHYEKYHFSEYAHNRAVMQKMPKAFVQDVANNTSISKSTTAKPAVHRAPKTQDPEVIKRRQANLHKILDYLEEKEVIWPYRDKSKYFTCACCHMRFISGKRIKRSQKDYIDVCYGCYNEAIRYRKKHSTPKPKIEYYPVNGLNKYQKR